MLIGITHTPQHEPILRVPRVLKVGIGLPKGRASYIYLHQGKWVIRYGTYENQKLVMKTVLQTSDRKEAEAYHAANKQNAAIRNYPAKIPFFTFTRRTITEEAGKPVEVFEPDFDAIEANGETPRMIDVVLMAEQPFSGEYQMWSATELKCHGDGVNALRVLSMAPAGYVPVNGDKMFPVDKCWTGGCQYALDGGGCKPSGTLTFQLAANMRLGSTAYFHTTGYRSISQIFSSLETIRMLAQRAGSSLVGLPLKMVLSPYRTNHNGQAATQYGVSLELRAEDMKALRAKFQESAWAPRQIAAPVVFEDEVAAETVAGEFYPDAVEDDLEEAAKPDVQIATERKTSALAEKLNAGVEAPVRRGSSVRVKASEPATAPAATVETKPAAPAPVGLTNTGIEPPKTDSDQKDLF